MANVLRPAVVLDVCILSLFETVASNSHMQMNCHLIQWDESYINGIRNERNDVLFVFKTIKAPQS